MGRMVFCTGLKSDGQVSLSRNLKSLGPARAGMPPSARMVHQRSRLGRQCPPALRHLLPLPQVFAGCTQGLTVADEAVAASLYLSVIQQAQPLVQADAANAVLEQAVRHNRGEGANHRFAGPAVSVDWPAI